MEHVRGVGESQIGGHLGQHSFFLVFVALGNLLGSLEIDVDRAALDANLCVSVELAELFERRGQFLPPQGEEDFAFERFGQVVLLRADDFDIEGRHIGDDGVGAVLPKEIVEAQRHGFLPGPTAPWGVGSLGRRHRDRHFRRLGSLCEEPAVKAREGFVGESFRGIPLKPLPHPRWGSPKFGKLGQEGRCGKAGRLFESQPGDIEMKFVTRHGEEQDTGGVLPGSPPFGKIFAESSLLHKQVRRVLRRLPLPGAEARRAALAGCRMAQLRLGQLSAARSCCAFRRGQGNGRGGGTTKRLRAEHDAAFW